MKPNKLAVFEEYMNVIENKENKTKFREVLEFMIQEFPHLETVVKWNQPMFLDHGTYIIAFNVTKNHINIAPEKATMIHFDELIKSKDVKQTMMFIQMKWNKPIDFELIKEVVEYNITEKKDTTSFWR
jgi:uncharacterized protein YdhG (YjbR/CyaY superfamily)